MDIQRLRNLTTQRLHTEMGDIYDDLEQITGARGLMTHMLPNMCRAVTPWLKQKVTDPRFWDGKYDTSHIGSIDIPAPTTEEQAAMRAAYAAMPSPFSR